MFAIKSENRKVLFCRLTGLVAFSLVLSSATSLWAVSNADYAAVPPFLSTEVKPNVLFIIDNSNSMDEDVDGAAVGSDSPLSRSEIARQAIMTIINENQDTMRFGIMAYDQSGVSKRYIHDSFYYASYDSSTYHPDHSPTPKDPSDNTKRFVNNTSAGEFIYYDTALPFYAGSNQGNGFCYSGNYTEDDDSNNDLYRCYNEKTGDLATPPGLPKYGEEGPPYGYGDRFGEWHFNPTDDDLAAGFTQFGYEMSWVAVGDTWFSNNSPGGGILHVNIADSDTGHLSAISDKLATSQFVTATDTPLRNAGLTPLGGTMHSALEYFQSGNVTSAAGVSPINPITLSCQKNYIILVTDGLPSVDSNGTTGDADTLLAEVQSNIHALRATNNTAFTESFDVKTFVVGFALPPELGSKLDDLAVEGGTAIDGHALIAHDAADLAQKLKRAFLDISTAVSSGAAASVISNTRSGEGVTYQSVFYPEFNDIDNRAVAWVGDVNALFTDAYGNLREDTNQNMKLDVELPEAPDFTPTDLIITYGHDVSGVRVFRYQDTNGNGTLDLSEDLNGNGVLDYDLNEDTNGNGILDAGEDLNNNNLLDDDVDEDRNGNGLLDIDEDANNDGVFDPGEDLNGDGVFFTVDTLVDTVAMQDIRYVWQASGWLNELSDADIIRQRVYNQADDRRYIFTFMDQDDDKVIDSGEEMAFVTDDPAQPDNSGVLARYLTAYPHQSDEPDWLESIRSNGNYADYLLQQTKRTINFIRGADQAEFTSATAIPYTLEEMRSRQADYDSDTTVETWRLGDIIHSAPVMIGKPAEAYHLLYDVDVISYAKFADKYEYRRNVVYVGGNDGMIHAFNGGFFDAKNLALSLRSVGIAEKYIDSNNNDQWDSGETYFDRDGDGVYDDGLGNETQYALGSELWAYIPENLLPHLRWLTKTNYQHVYYNDLKPKVVDAKVFTEESACTTNGIDDAGCIHPDGWGTLLISGMRFGGGEYPLDANWDFDADSVGWQFYDGTGASESFGDDAWTVTATQDIASPYFISPGNIDIDADKIKTVEIRFLTTPSGASTGGAELFWNSSGNGQFIEGSQSVNSPSVDVDGKYHVYKFDMAENTDWHGTLQQLRVNVQGTLVTGASISVDYVDLGDGSGAVSSYVIMDITDPERAPIALAEINIFGLGYTTSFPTVVPLKSETDATKNDWYLFFGNGPNHNSLATAEARDNADSNTEGKVFVLSLNHLVGQHDIYMLNEFGQGVPGLHTFSTFDSNAFVSDLITVDLDLDYDADAVYFGTVSGNETAGWGGKLRRIVLNEGDTNTMLWDGDSVLFDPNDDPNVDNQAITAAPSIGIDDQGKFWIYFGTGRFFTRDDVNITDTQSYYGIKEPTDAPGPFYLGDAANHLTWATVNRTNLLDTTAASIFDDKTITGLGALNAWDDLISEIDNNRAGWWIDFPVARRRNLSQAALFGDVVTFTTYEPSADLCSSEGLSYGQALYYKTGTAHFKSIIGVDVFDNNGNGRIDDGQGEKKLESTFLIGTGQAASPAIHSDKDGGSSALFQTSGGSIFKIKEKNPGMTKSGKTSWNEL